MGEPAPVALWTPKGTWSFSVVGIKSGSLIAPRGMHARDHIMSSMNGKFLYLTSNHSGGSPPS